MFWTAKFVAVNVLSEIALDGAVLDTRAGAAVHQHRLRAAGLRITAD
jgi:hypothetical protein